MLPCACLLKRASRERRTGKPPAKQEAKRLLEEYFRVKMESCELRHENTGLSAQPVMGSVMNLVDSPRPWCAQVQPLGDRR